MLVLIGLIQMAFCLLEGFGTSQILTLLSTSKTNTPKIKIHSPEMHIKVVGTGLDISLVNLLKSVGVHYLGRVDYLGEI